MTELITPLLSVFAHTALFIAGFFVLTLWVISVAMRDSSIVDIFWGLGSAAVAWVAWLTVGGGDTRAALVLVVATAWGLRLGLYIGIRNWGAEDRRYARLRQHVTEQGRNYALYSLRAVFGLQGLLMFLCTMPVVVAIAMPSSGPPGLLFWIGFGLSAAGLTVEALADWQMARFRRQRAIARRGHGQRPVALFAPPQLLRRNVGSMGRVSDGMRRRIDRHADHLCPSAVKRHDHGPPRRQPARATIGQEKPWLSRLRPSDQRIHSLATPSTLTFASITGEPNGHRHSD